MSQKLKILYLITKSNWGGAQRYVFDLATHLPRNQYTVAVASGGEGVLLSKLREKNVQTFPLSNLVRDVKIWSDLVVFINLVKLLRAEHPDVVHLNSSKIGGLGALAARVAGIKRIIFTAHGWAFNEARPRWQKLLIKISHWATAILCHRVITISEWERNQVNHWPWLKKRIQTIYNGQESGNLLTKSDARQELAKRSPSLGDASLWLGTIAELHQNKGLDFAISAFAQAHLPAEAKLIIIGEGEERPRLEKLIQKQKLSSRVFLLGQVPEAKKCLPALDIFILPSRKEGLPYAILEAGSAQLPVIASRIGGIPEILSANTGIMIPVGDTHALAQAIERLASNPNLRDELGAALKEVIATKFSFNQMLTQTEALYK